MTSGAEVPGDDAVLAAVRERADDLVRVRRDLHQHPEPSWEEHRTTRSVAARLGAAGLEPRELPTGTGLICDVGTSGPLVALRADLDALRMSDSKDVPYRSTVAGVCHACGHDVHTAALLGAGLALHQVLEPGAGRVRLLFQPAEEAVPGGAVAMVAAGAMHDVEAVFALHCDPTLEVGQVGLSAGAVTSASDMLRITVTGPGGHTARPHRTVDVVHVLAKLAVDLPQGLARLSDARDALNLTFGAIEAGDAANVIPTHGTLLGSLRAGGRTSWEDAGPRLRRLVSAIVEPFGATWDLVHHRGAPPIVNDPWATDLMAAAARSAMGPLAVGPTAQSGGGEDFAWYLDHAPGAYARLGVRAPGAPVTDIHAAAFDVDERSVASGSALLATTALHTLRALRFGAAIE